MNINILGLHLWRILTVVHGALRRKGTRTFRYGRDLVLP